MAHRVISSDSEDDDYDVPIGKSKVIRNKRIVDSYNEEEDSVNNPHISSFSSSASSEVDSEPESNANESFSPLQAAHKRMTKQKVILSDDEEEDPSFAPPKDDRKPAIDKKMIKQRVILSDEEEDSSFSPPKDDRKLVGNKVDNKDALTTANAEMNVQLVSREVVGDEVNTQEEEETVEERTESSSESNKENTPPPSNSSLPEKPATALVLGVSQAKPLVHVPAKEGLQTVMTAQKQVPAYHVAYTRPALLKQLEYVKVS